MTLVDLFGNGTDGYARAEGWLGVMCVGCTRDYGRNRTGLGGMSCTLTTRALLNPYEADMPEWSPDATPVPPRFSELGSGRWPVCMEYTPRKTRSDAGMRRGPRNKTVPGVRALTLW